MIKTKPAYSSCVYDREKRDEWFVLPVAVDTYS